MTINVFMGEDAVSPYYPFLEKGKGVFALVKTSNPSGKDFQDLMVGSETLYERTAKKVAEWGEALHRQERLFRHRRGNGP